MRSGGTRRLGRLLGCTLLALVAGVVGAGPASAHADLVGSVPADGANVQVAPRQLVLELSESVELKYTTVQITDGDGHDVPVSRIQLDKTPGAGTEQPTRLLVGLPVLAPNLYRVSWRTLSSDDLHTTSGVLVFGVQHPVLAAAGVSTEPQPGGAEVGWRWLALLGLGLALGSAALYALLRDTDAGWRSVRAARARLATAGAVGAAVGVAAGVGLLVTQLAATADAWGAARQLLLGTSYGGKWLALELSGLALLVVALRLRAPLRAGLPTGSLRTPAVVVGVAAVGVTAATALVGHAGASPGRAGGYVVATALHGLAALVWTGSVLAAAAVLLPWRRSWDRELWRPVLRRFGLVASACVAVLVLTGLVMTGHLVATPNALVSSFYGRALLVKLGLGLLVGLLGLANTVLLRPQVAARLFGPGVRTGWVRATVAAEATLMLVLLLAVGVLVSSQPANSPRWASPDGSGPLLAGQADDLVESFSVSPNLPGQTFINVAVFNSRRPAPGVVQGVDVRMHGPQGQQVTRTAILGDPAGVSVAGSSSGANEVPAAYVVAGGDITMPGRWRFDVVVHRPGLPDATTTYDWTVADPQAAGRPDRLPSTPLAPPLDELALTGVLLLLALGAGVAVGVSRRRRLADAAPAEPLVGAAQASSSDAPR